MLKVVAPHQNPTHKFFRHGVWIYVVASGVIDVAHACVLDVKDVWVKNGDKWDRAS